MVNFALLELNIILSPIRLTNKFQFMRFLAAPQHSSSKLGSAFGLHRNSRLAEIYGCVMAMIKQAYHCSSDLHVSSNLSVSFVSLISTHIFALKTQRYATYHHKRTASRSAPQHHDCCQGRALLIDLTFVKIRKDGIKLIIM